jgi:hypothetical protein
MQRITYRETKKKAALGGNIVIPDYYISFFKKIC